MEKTAAARERLTRPDGSPVRALVVDDEPLLGDLLSTALRYEGWQVETALTGRAATKAAATLDPDVVVLDIMLPDMSGLDVLRRLRESRPLVPVLFLTAKDAVEDRIAGLTAGADDYVTKPFSLEEVVARLRALLRRAGATAQASDARLVVGDLALEQRVARLVPTYQESRDGPDNYGCGVLADGRIVTTAIGNESGGDANGQLEIWFPPFTGETVSFCKLDLHPAPAHALRSSAISGQARQPVQCRAHENLEAHKGGYGVPGQTDEWHTAVVAECQRFSWTHVNAPEVQLAVRLEPGKRARPRSGRDDDVLRRDVVERFQP